MTRIWSKDQIKDQLRKVCLKHQHIVRYLGSHRDEEYFHMYLELASGGSLDDMMFNSQDCGADAELSVVLARNYQGLARNSCMY